MELIGDFTLKSAMAYNQLVRFTIVISRFFFLAARHLCLFNIM